MKTDPDNCYLNKNGPQGTTNLFATKEVGDLCLRVLCKQWPQGFLVGLQCIQYVSLIIVRSGKHPWQLKDIHHSPGLDKVLVVSSAATFSFFGRLHIRHARHKV